MLAWKLGGGKQINESKPPALHPPGAGSRSWPCGRCQDGKPLACRGMSPQTRRHGWDSTWAAATFAWTEVPRWLPAPGEMDLCTAGKASPGGRCQAGLPGEVSAVPEGCQAAPALLAGGGGLGGRGASAAGKQLPPRCVRP